MLQKPKILNPKTKKFSHKIAKNLPNQAFCRKNQTSTEYILFTAINTGGKLWLQK